MILLREDKPPALYLNLRAAKFQDVIWEAGEPIARNAFLDAHAVDFDHDGYPDLALWSTMASRVLKNCGDGKFAQVKPAIPAVAPPAARFAARGAIADLNSDGFEDLLAIGSDGNWHSSRTAKAFFRKAAITLPAAAMTVDALTTLRLDGRGVALAGVGHDRTMFLWTVGLD